MTEADLELENEPINFAFVFFGTIKDFVKIKELASQQTSARLIFQKKSYGHLIIRKEDEENGNKSY